MLPNLSGLKTNRDTLSSSESIPEQASKVAKGQEILDVDWKWLIDISSSKDVNFKVTAPRVEPGADRWAARFIIRKGKISMTTSGGRDECVVIEPNAKSQQVDLDSLFYALADDVITKCEITPAIKFGGGGGGSGNFVLQVCDGIAAVLGWPISLTDLAEFPIKINREYPFGSMSHMLAVERGYGYYEARGYFAQQAFAFYQRGKYQLEGHELQKELASVQRIDLLWTHTIFTTPLKELLEAIRTFPTKMSGPDGAVPEFHQTNYTEKWAANHVINAKAVVDPFRQWLSLHDVANKECMKRLEEFAKLKEVPRYADMSVRELMRLVNYDAVALEKEEVGDLQTYVKLFVRDVWTRSFGSKEYPGDDLCKYIDRETRKFLVCEPDPLYPLQISGPPKVGMRATRTDMMVNVL